MQFEEHEYRELQNFLVNKFEKQYAINDRAHRLDHVVSVAELALEINERLELQIDRRLIVIPAICHDLFTWSRSNHQTLAYHYLKTLNESWILAFDEHERELMASACAEHRASYDGSYTSILSELIASADRGRPTDFDTVVRRAVDYAEGVLKLSTEEARVKAVEHVKEKFGRSGYARYPLLYMRVFGDELKQLQDKVSKLDGSYFQ